MMLWHSEVMRSKMLSGTRGGQGGKALELPRDASQEWGLIRAGEDLANQREARQALM